MTDQTPAPTEQSTVGIKPESSATPGTQKSVERLFPFVLKSRGLIVGRDSLWRKRSKLQFVLITTDLSEGSQERILQDFAPYPIVRHYEEADLLHYFGVRGAKVLGFVKSGLSKSIYAALKPYRLNKPPLHPRPQGQPNPVEAIKSSAG